MNVGDVTNTETPTSDNEPCFLCGELTSGKRSIVSNLSEKGHEFPVCDAHPPSESNELLGREVLCNPKYQTPAEKLCATVLTALDQLERHSIAISNVAAIARLQQATSSCSESQRDAVDKLADSFGSLVLAYEQFTNRSSQVAEAFGLMKGGISAWL